MTAVIFTIERLENVLTGGRIFFVSPPLGKAKSTEPMSKTRSVSSQNPSFMVGKIGRYCSYELLDARTHGRTNTNSKNPFF